MKNINILGLAACLVITGCAAKNGLNEVKNRASFDLDCPSDKIQIQTIGSRSYGAKGCGKRASYTTNRCWSGDYDGCTAQLNQVIEDK